MSPQQPLHLLEWLSIHQGLLLLLVTYKLFPSSKTPVSFWKFTPHSLCSESLVNPGVYPIVWSGHLRWLFFFFFCIFVVFSILIRTVVLQPIEWVCITSFSLYCDCVTKHLMQIWWNRRLQWDWMLQKCTLLKVHYALKMGVEWKQGQRGQAWAFWSMGAPSYILHVL